MKNAGKACNNRLYRHIRTFEKIVKNYFVIYIDNYNDISSYCHAYNEPVFITKNGKGDLAVMSMETYEEMAGRIELYSKLQEGLADIDAGNTRPFADVMADLRHRRERR